MISKTLIGAAVGFLMAAAPLAAPLAFAAASTTAPTITTTVAPTSTLAAPGTIAPTITATVAPSATLAALESQVAALIKQVAALTAQLAHVRTEQKVAAHATLAIVNQLHRGSRGKSVRVLQRLLASNPAIYPRGLVTGYYGRLTEDAVKKFQQDNGIESVGDVGPQTRSVLNAYLSHATSTIPARFLQEFETEGTATSTNTAIATHRVRLVRMCHREGFSGRTNTIAVAGRVVFAHIREGDSIGECNRESGDRNRSEARNHGRMGYGERRGNQSERSSVGSEQNSTTTESTTSSSGDATTASSSDSSSGQSGDN